jgi:exodeoxyribonuclease-5
LNGELQGSDTEQRALELLGQLGIEPVTDPKIGLSPAELAGTVMRTLNLPEIARLCSRLVPEHSVFGHRTNAEGEVLISGIADAIAPDGEGGVDVVIDWKSDVNPSTEAIDQYRKQISEYRRTIGSKQALLVFMTRSNIIEVL